MSNLDEVVQWLMEHKVGSIGPQTVMALARVADSIKAVGDLPDNVQEFYKALVTVAIVSTHHQGAVIEALAKLVEGRQKV